MQRCWISKGKETKNLKQYLAMKPNVKIVGHPVTFSTIFITHFLPSYIDCCEVSQSVDGNKGIKFFALLYS